MKRKILQRLAALLRVCLDYCCWGVNRRFARRAAAGLAFFIAFLFSNHIEAANTYAATLVRSSLQFFSAPDSSSLSITGDLTIEAWVKLASQPSSGSYTIVSKSTESGGQQSFGLRYFNNGGGDTLDAWIYPNGTSLPHASIAETIPSGQWTHIAMVYSASAGAITFYVNGVQTGATQTGLPNSIYDGTAPLLIGGYDQGYPTTLFDGQIDDVRLWAVARTQQQISSAMSSELLGTEPNLRGYWKLNNSLFDSTTNGNTLVNNNSATFENTDLPFWSIPLTVIETNRTPKAAEITPQLAALPTTSQLLAYHGGIFTTNLASIDPNQTTIVLTHGWNSTPNDWPLNMAALITANINPAPNIFAWDWSLVAQAALPGIPEAQTGDQGRALGEKLLLALGASYSKRIQFIGHSLGTLVNASAANYLHGDSWAEENASPTPWLAGNTLMTLFDEAEAATGITSFGSAIDTLIGKNGNPLTPKQSYDHPLPKQFAWAENYVAAFGLLHPEAVNVILTNKFPTDEPNGFSSWRDDLTTFHDYPMNWYDETIQDDNSVMGFVWPFLWSVGDAAFANAPSAGAVYVQAGSEWDLTATSWTEGTNLLAGRFQKYRIALFNSGVQFVANTLTANGTVNGDSQVAGLPSWVINMSTSSGNGGSVTPQSKLHPLGLAPNDASSNTNIPAYAWMQLVIPTNAVSMSFDYIIQGDWQSDSLAAAFNGTNVLLIAGNEIQTNVTFSSGSIDVSAFAGQTNEFFIGIVGGTSTNAQVTVENLAFSISAPPLLQAQTSVGGLVLSWPLSAANFSLQTTTNLADPNSWVMLTNVPAIVNLQNAITNPASDGARFYRLKK